jgi:hypothetical protein
MIIPDTFPRECWVVAGVTSESGPFLSRILKNKEFDAEAEATRKATWMNSLGANVVVRHQRLNESSQLWEDCP